jgi:Fe2+ or Zn2+ uptake regulation protein
MSQDDILKVLKESERPLTKYEIYKSLNGRLALNTIVINLKKLLDRKEINFIEKKYPYNLGKTTREWFVKNNGGLKE